MIDRHWFVLLLLACCGPTANAQQQWGDLSMRFDYDGESPKPQLLRVNAGHPAVVDESLVVHADDRGIRNVVVWLERSKEFELPIHPDYSKTATASVPVVMAGGRFEPHVAVVRTGQTLAISNFDPHGHNVKVDFFRNLPFAFAMEPGQTSSWSFRDPEFAPSFLSDSIHPWMSGYLLVRDNPYAAVSNAHGKLKISKLPAGKWTFVVWHEKSGFVKKATQGDKKHEWPRGRFTLEIKAGDNDLGEFKIAL